MGRTHFAMSHQKKYSSFQGVAHKNEFNSPLEAGPKRMKIMFITVTRKPQVVGRFAEEPLFKVGITVLTRKKKNPQYENEPISGSFFRQSYPPISKNTSKHFFAFKLKLQLFGCMKYHCAQNASFYAFVKAPSGRNHLPKD